MDKEGRSLILPPYNSRNTTQITTFSRCGLMATMLDCDRRGHMADTQEKDTWEQTNQPCCFFEIRIRGHLSSEWSDWFENMEIRLLESGETALYGPIADQAALMGILNKLVRLNLPLLSVNEVSRNEPIEGQSHGKSSGIESQT